MSEERLQEIKDSIELQVLYTEKHNFDKTLLQEEVDLYNEVIKLNNIINELEKCVQNYIYAIEPRGCSINYNCEYDSEEDYINAMKEQSKLNTFKFILDKINELKGEQNE